ncbi:fibrobacter succinogenes major paralogous domain-containing protein [Fibrobacter sp. UWB13]|uniref:fibrobacter succinogenes major paralogous domain-containing protein n=1 Tax=Fibrobacter sp. UWB13 TaxID=1896204 RepID=UPI000A0A78A8|nr:fibrobacter succinogenes major paralogous domain-containing protein [Fibrobacter sp. UWB13]SMG15577.1 major paralogous domain-containing protein [Fibrobacter sp. UWB13]
MSLIKTWCKKALRGCVATAAISSVLLLTACGDDSSSSGPNNNASREVVAVKNKSISGVSQKGPFVTGSVVKLYELDGESYAQTGKNFTGKITSDDGKFSISSVSLASQYALLEANGYFHNEIMGNKSQSTITLNALTDLSDRKTVNINLLTHLEYERALYLMREGKGMSSAKKQAEAEILNAFGIKGEFASSEDLDIFSKGDGNAALLAFSVLMLRDLSEADLTELLTKFATDIEKDGVWDDEENKTNIADWTQMKDYAGELATIRANIEKWNLGTVPEFEKYVRNFWYTNYGLGKCDASNKAEVKEALKNKGTFCCTVNGWVNVSKGKGWRWDVPKEAHLNPNINYGTLTDSRDGLTYKTVKIGNQVWMAENLNYADSTKTPSLLKRSWCYNNVAANCDVVGRLYTWAAAIDSVALYDAGKGIDCGFGKTCTLPAKVQGICPSGWHLPTKAEWETLFTEVGGELTAGKILKSQTGWNYDGRNGNGTDGVGFSALPAGGRGGDGGFVGDGYNTVFLSAKIYGSNACSGLYLDGKYEGAGLDNGCMDYAFSVRCLKDES